MKTLAKILAVSCAVLFVISGVLALTLFNVEQKAFTAKTYKQAFSEQGLYEKMPAVLAGAMTTSIAENPNADPYLKALTQPDWERTIAALLPPDELKTLTDDALDSVFDYVNGKTDSASVSLLPFKRRMAGESGVEAVKQVLAAQPACTAAQLTQMGLNLISGGEMILCNPPAEMVDLFSPMIETQLQVMTIAIPDEVTLIKGNQAGTPNDPRRRLGQLRAGIKLTPILPLLFLFGLTMFAVRSLSDWLKWWGVPFLITGALSALLAVIGSPLAGGFIGQALSSGSLPPALLSLTQETVGAAARQVLSPVVTQGLILAAAGLAMAVIGFLLARRTVNR